MELKSIAWTMAIISVAFAMLNWGVAYERNEITLKSGDSYQFYTNIQNMEDTAKNVTVSVEGDGIAKPLDDKDYYVLNPNTKMAYYIEIKIPNNPPKETYRITVTYTASPVGAGINIATEKSVVIKVTVSDYGKTTTSNQGNTGTTSSGTIDTQSPQEDINQTVNETNTTETKEPTQKTEKASMASGTGVGITVTDPIASYIPLIIILGAIGVGTTIAWKKGVIDEFRDITGI